MRHLSGQEPAPLRLAILLQAQRERLTLLEQECAAVLQALDVPVPPDHPHRHLAHRALPDIDPLKSPSRLAHAWSMVSISVLLLGMAAVVLSRSALVWLGAIAALIVGALLLEALARGRLARFARTTVVPLLVLAGLAVVVAVFTLNWRYGVAGMLTTAAVALLVGNLRDFLSKR